MKSGVDVYEGTSFYS